MDTNMIKQIVDALQQLPEWQYIRKLMEQSNSKSNNPAATLENRGSAKPSTPPSRRGSIGSSHEGDHATNPSFGGDYHTDGDKPAARGSVGGNKFASMTPREKYERDRTQREMAYAALTHSDVTEAQSKRIGQYALAQGISYKDARAIVLA